MDRTKFDLENIIYWARRPLEMIKGQCRLSTEEKVPMWTVLVMYMYCIVIFAIYLYSSGPILYHTNRTIDVPIIGQIFVMLFFSLMVYGIFLVIAMNLIAIGIVNTSKKTVINLIRNIGTLIPILMAIMLFITAQCLLAERCIILAIIMNILFFIIEKITDKK